MGFGRKQKDRQKHKPKPRQGHSPDILRKGHHHAMEEYESEDDAINAQYEEYLDTLSDEQD